MIPSQPGQPRSIGAEARGSVEVVAGNEHGPGGPAAQVDGHQGVDGFSSRVGMILTHTDQTIATAIDDGIGVPEAVSGRQPFRRPARPLPVELLVVVIRKVHDAPRDGDGAAPVFVRPRAGVERGWCDVGDRTIGCAAHNHVASALSRPLLDPIDVTSVDGDLPKCQGRRSHQFGGDRGRPRAVRGGTRCRHPRMPCPAWRTRAAGCRRAGRLLFRTACRPFPQRGRTRRSRDRSERSGAAPSGVRAHSRAAPRLPR